MKELYEYKKKGGKFDNMKEKIKKMKKDGLIVPDLNHDELGRKVDKILEFGD